MNKAYLIALILPSYNSKSINEEIEEMILLANTLNFDIIDTFIQKKTSPD